MLLDIEDNRLRVTHRDIGNGRRRLVIEYPGEPAYRDRVLAAVASLIVPRASASERLMDAAAADGEGL